ncbi:MAG: DUF3857 domain-containing protein [Flavobacteriaceae bacterium]|nr:DUF3857 domain-containing protein [Flavobacteriaceae bacterium]
MARSFHPNPIKTALRLVCGAFLLGTLGANAQASLDLDGYKTLYPNSQSVRLNQEIQLDIAIEKGRFQISKASVEEDLYLYESAKFDAKQSINYSTFYELDEIEASSFVYKEAGYEELKVSEFQQKDELDGSFYDDIKSVNFIFPSLGEGAKTKLKYTQSIKDPRFLSAFYFANFFPIANNKITITADKDITLRFEEINMEGVDFEFSETSTRNQKTYTWTITDVKPFKYESSAPDYKSILPHIIPIIVSYQSNGKTVKVLDDIADLYHWYFSLVKDLNADEAPAELVALVNGLVSDQPNELEKVRAIYYWVQENIKYIAFEYALGGFVPREANEVFRKKYGDCKDNSSLLLKMLEIAGIKGNLTWIGTRSIPYKYEDVPTPSADNHMILHYAYQGRSYYLDATGRFNPIEVPSSFIQGKEALISMGRDSFMIKEVPIVPPTENRFQDRATIELQGNTLVGQGSSTLIGYGKMDLFYRLEEAQDETEVRALYNSVFRKGANSFLIDGYEETNKYDYDKEFTVSYGFNIPNYAKTFGDEVYINMNLSRSIASNLKTEDDRKAAYEHRYLDMANYTYTLKIPEGYSVDYLPPNMELESPFVDFAISYELKGDELIYTQSFTLKQLVLDLEAQKTTNALTKKVVKNHQEVVVLKKK